MSDLNNTGLLYSSATPTKIDPAPINQEEKKDMVKEPEATSSASASSGRILKLQAMDDLVIFRTTVLENYTVIFKIDFSEGLK